MSEDYGLGGLDGTEIVPLNNGAFTTYEAAFYCI